MAMWVHGVSALPERTAGDAGADGPLVQVQNIPWSDIAGLRQGFGATFRGKRHHHNWFHFSIPTPVMVPTFNPRSQTYDQPYGQRARLERVFVLHRAESRQDLNGQILANAWVTDVHVWDGTATRYVLQSFPGDDSRIDGQLGDDGRHDLALQERRNSWRVLQGGVPATPPVNWGIAISVRVHFGVESEILFAAAGADFLLEVA
jgi:hypothetical protein